MSPFSPRPRTAVTPTRAMLNSLFNLHTPNNDNENPMYYRVWTTWCIRKNERWVLDKDKKKGVCVYSYRFNLDLICKITYKKVFLMFCMDVLLYRVPYSPSSFYFFAHKRARRSSAKTTRVNWIVLRWFSFPFFFFFFFFSSWWSFSIFIARTRFPKRTVWHIASKCSLHHVKKKLHGSYVMIFTLSGDEFDADAVWEWYG